MLTTEKIKQSEPYLRKEITYPDIESLPYAGVGDVYRYKIILWVGEMRNNEVETDDRKQASVYFNELIDEGVSYQNLNDTNTQPITVAIYNQRTISEEGAPKVVQEKVVFDGQNLYTDKLPAEEVWGTGAGEGGEEVPIEATDEEVGDWYEENYEYVEHFWKNKMGGVDDYFKEKPPKRFEELSDEQKQFIRYWKSQYAEKEEQHAFVENFDFDIKFGGIENIKTMPELVNREEEILAAHREGIITDKEKDELLSKIEARKEALTETGHQE